MLKVDKKQIGSEIINIKEVKSWLRVTYDDDDALITSLIVRSRELVEEYLNISIVDTEITLTATARKTLILPFTNINTPVEIVRIRDLDGNNVPYTYNHFEVSFEPTTWSPTQPESPEYVETITHYVVSSNYEGLKLPLLEIIAYLYENRGDVINYDNLLSHNKYLEQFRNKIWI